MFRRKHIQSPGEEPIAKRIGRPGVIDYEKQDSAESRKSFWPDGVGWSQLSKAILLHGLVEPILFVLIIWGLAKLLW